MKNSQTPHRLHRLAEEIALLSPELARLLCENGISKLGENERRHRTAWLEACIPASDDSSPLISWPSQPRCRSVGDR